VSTLRMRDVRAAADLDLGISDWMLVDQKRIDAFADATDDHQWIHVDRERAEQGPFGVPIAHGYLTLSLLAPILEQILRVDDAAMMINYGLERVRFPAPLPVESRVRGRGVMLSASEVPGGVQARVDVQVEAEGLGKPVCVAEVLVRLAERGS
jgi:acyl dehydratase